MPAPTKRSSAKKKPRTRVANDQPEALVRTQVHDVRHIGYTQPGTQIGHLMPWAQKAILGHDPVPKVVVGVIT